MRGWLAIGFLCALTLAGEAPRAATSSVSIAVLDFYDLGQDPDWRWMGKGLADMSITDLATVDDVHVLDREALQAYRRELALHATGLVDDTTLLELGRTARVDHVIFGTFAVRDDSRITIQATLVNIPSGQIKTRANVTGPVADFFLLQDTLVRKLIDGLGIVVGDDEARRLTVQWTESLDAAAHFYTSQDHYDRGEPELALAEARVAARIDPSYLPARFWIGRLYIELAEYEHAELALEALLALAHDRAYVVHTRLLIAQLYDKYLGQPQKAVDHLEAVGRWLEPSIEQLNVRFQLGQIYDEIDAHAEAYEVFRRLARPPQRAPIVSRAALPYRSVNMLTPQQIRAASIQKYQSAFLNAYYHDDSNPVPSREMVLLTPENPEFTRTERVENGSYSRSKSDVRPLFYAPKGLRFKAFTLTFRGSQTQISVRPYVHLREDFSQIGLKSDLPDPQRGRSSRRYDATQEFIQAILFDASVRGPGSTFSWSVHAEFMPVDAPQPGSVAYWSKLLDDNTTHPIVLDTPGHTGGDVSLLEDRAGGLWAAYDTNRDLDENAADSDVWYFRSDDKVAWPSALPLRAVNSVANDYAPDLQQDDAGRYILVFVSDRRGEDELWISTSINGRKWHRPRRVRLPGLAGYAELADVRSPRLFQDRRGRYRLGFYHVPSDQVMLTTSRDLVHWESPLALPIGLNQQPGDDVTIDYFQDATAVYRLVVSRNFSYDTPMRLGSSNDATRWAFTLATFKGNSHPAVIHDRNGRYALVFGSNGEGLHYLHQAWSADWTHWSQAELLPRIHYFADTYMPQADIIQTRDGYYWIAVPKSHGHKLHLFRLERFPATTIADVYIRKDRIGRIARDQLDREEQKLEALKAGDEELARCLSRARRYQSCLGGTRS